MIGFRRSRFLLVIAAAVGLATTAWAEGIFPVNDPGTGSWVFDQPSAVTDGAVIHVAFVGDNAKAADGSPNTRLYYAAVNGGVDFANIATTRSQVLLTTAVAIDNTLFNNARHPVIALLSATDLAIVFQAIPSDNATSGFKLFRALLTVVNSVVTSQRVDEIRDAAGARLPGSLTDPSFGIVITDNTLRVTYSSFPSLVAGAPYSDVYFARVGWNTSRVLNTPILLTTTAASTGVFALPRLVLDGNTYSHIVWAANNSDPTRTTPSAIYYAMVQAIAPSVVDNMAIGATQVLTGGNRWGFPNILLTGPSNIWILAGDEPPSGWSTGLAGSIGVSEINPYAVVHDGNPVNVTNAGANTLFFLNPPGGSVLSSDFDAYQPEAALDTQNRMQVAGYGFRFADGHGTPGRYYVMSLGTTASGAGTTAVFSTMVSSPATVGIGDIAFATQLPGDYTRPAFVHFSGRAVNFWSGPDNVVTGARNLYVTTAFSPPDPTKQSGCSMVGDPRLGEAGRIPGAAVLLLPAALLALRRAIRKAFAR